MTLSVVIPVLGRHDALERTLRSLDRQQAAEPFEVIVAPDTAEPDPEAVAAIAHGRRVVAARRPGASAARNAGWRAARAPVVLFLGADILGAPDLVARHQAAHREHPDVQDAVLGHVRWADGLRVTAFMRWLDHGTQFDYPVIREHGAAWAHLYTANVSLKTALLDAVGGFDEERFPFLYEDTDLGLRLHARGLRLHYEPRAVGEHDHPQTLAGWERRMAAVARMERAFVDAHPEQRPWFWERLGGALGLRRSLGLGRPLTRIVEPHRGRLGRWAWRSTDRYYRQRLAPAFLGAWDQVPASSGPK